MPAQEDTQRLDQIQASIQKLQDELDEQKHRHFTHAHKGSDLTQRLDTGSALNAYSGFVKSDGTAVSPYMLPTGWSSSLSSHLFTITHNLGTLTYAAVATPVNTAAFCQTRGYTTTKFDVEIFGPSFTLVDVDWTFVLVVNS